MAPSSCKPSVSVGFAMLSVNGNEEILNEMPITAEAIINIKNMMFTFDIISLNFSRIIFISSLD